MSIYTTSVLTCPECNYENWIDVGSPKDFKIDHGEDCELPEDCTEESIIAWCEICDTYWATTEKDLDGSEGNELFVLDKAHLRDLLRYESFYDMFSDHIDYDDFADTRAEAYAKIDKEYKSLGTTLTTHTVKG